jgi:hypothetical protein
MRGTCTAAVASPRAAAMSDPAVPPPLTRPIAFSEVRIGRAAWRSRHTAASLVRGESSTSESSPADASRASRSPRHAPAAVSPVSHPIVGSQTWSVGALLVLICARSTAQRDQSPCGQLSGQGRRAWASAAGHWRDGTVGQRTIPAAGVHPAIGWSAVLR